MKEIIAMTLLSTMACVGCAESVAGSDSPARQTKGTTAPVESTVSSLCKPGDTVIFACRVRRSGKLVSLCAAADFADRQDADVYYAFGRPGKLELRYPNEPAPARDHFMRTHLFLPGATGGYVYSFANAGFKYYLYSISGTGREEQGVVVTAPGEEHALSELSCDPRSVTESTDPRVFDAARSWREDADIRDHGLPRDFPR